MSLSVSYVLQVDHHQIVRKININLCTRSLVHLTINCEGLNQPPGLSTELPINYNTVKQNKYQHRRATAAWQHPLQATGHLFESEKWTSVFHHRHIKHEGRQKGSTDTKLKRNGYPIMERDSCRSFYHHCFQTLWSNHCEAGERLLEGFFITHCQPISKHGLGLGVTWIFKF